LAEGFADAESIFSYSSGLAIGDTTAPALLLPNGDPNAIGSIVHDDWVGIANGELARIIVSCTASAVDSATAGPASGEFAINGDDIDFLRSR
jgi:hypothetical protein